MMSWSQFLRRRRPLAVLAVAAVILCGLVFGPGGNAAASSPAQVTQGRPDYTPVGWRNQPAPSAAALTAWQQMCAKQLPGTDSPAGTQMPCSSLNYAEAAGAQSGTAAKGTAGAPAAAAAAAVGGLPPGYSLESVAGGFNSPTKVTWLPDGSFLVLEKSGVIWRVVNGAVQFPPVLDYSAKVNQFGDRGGLSMLVTSTFATDKRVYIYTTNENFPSEVNNCKTASVRYFTLNGNAASAVSAPIIGATQGTRCNYDANGEPTGYSCGSATANDCIPCDDWSHCAGDLIEFAGNICLTTGDASSYNYVDARALRSFDPASLAGKMLCVDKSGNGLTSNPKYASASPKGNASRYYAAGMRNCFRASVIGGTLYCGNVGWGLWERVNRVTKDSNQGWPCYEGGTAAAGGIGAGSLVKQDDYANNAGTKTRCQQLYAAANAKAPVFAYSHFGGGAAIVLGKPFGAHYPASENGSVLVADYTNGQMWTIRMDANGVLTSWAPFATAAGFYPVDIETGPDGDLYLVDIGSGTINHLVYATPSSTTTCPDWTWKASYWNNMTQAGSPVTVRCEDLGGPKLAHTWHGDSPSGVTNGWSSRYECNCGFDGVTYKFSLGSDDGARAWVNGQLIIDQWADHAFITTTTNRTEPDAPVVVKVDYYQNGGEAALSFDWVETTGPKMTITIPANGTQYTAGQAINFSGTATSSTGAALPASAITWNTALVHCYISAGSCHSHPSVSIAGVSQGSTPYPAGDASGADECYYVVLSATAKAPDGATNTAAVNLPNANHPACP